MSDIFNHHFESQYRTPGVEPTQSLMMTFSAQRWDPLGRSPARPTDLEAFSAVQEMVLTEMPPLPVFSLAFPPAHVVVSGCCARWAQKLHDFYGKVRKWAHSTRRSITACLVASYTAFCNAVGGACDASMRVVGPLIGAAREMDFRRVFICVALD